MREEIFSWEREARGVLLGGTIWAASGADELLTCDVRGGDGSVFRDGRRHSIALLKHFAMAVGVEGRGDNVRSRSIDER